VPGACMLQMVKEIISSALSYKVQMVKAADIKFVRMVNPVEDSALRINIQYASAADLLHITATIFKGTEPYLKAKLVFNYAQP